MGDEEFEPKKRLINIKCRKIFARDLNEWKNTNVAEEDHKRTYKGSKTGQG